MFWPQFLWGRTPEFLDLRYKILPDCDHVAKFHGDRPREFGDLVAKEKKTSRVKHKAFGTNVPGGLIKLCNKKAQLSLTNPRDACEKFARFT